MEAWAAVSLVAAALALVLGLRRSVALSDAGLAAGLLLAALGVSLLQLSLDPAVVSLVPPASVLILGLLAGAALWAAGRTQGLGRAGGSGQSGRVERAAGAVRADRRLRDSPIGLVLAGTGIMLVLFWLEVEGDVSGALHETMALSAASGFCAGGTVLALFAWLRPDRPRQIGRDALPAVLLALAGAMGVLAGVPAMQCYEWFEGMRPGMGYMAGLPVFAMYAAIAGGAAGLWGRLRGRDVNGRLSFVLLSTAAGLLGLATGTSVALVPAGLALGVALHAGFGARGGAPAAPSDAVGVDESNGA